MIAYAVTIVCTGGKQRHRELQLQRMQRHGERWYELLPNPKTYEPGDNFQSVELGSVDAGAHRIKCRRCGRDTLVNPVKLAQALNLVAAYGNRLDISHLPF